jgi:hypothetical protein
MQNCFLILTRANAKAFKSIFWHHKKVHYTALTTDSNQFDAKISQWQANTLGFSERREAEAAALTG